MSAESFAADRFVYETLNADVGLQGKVHDALAPEGAVPPYVVFQQQAGTDVPTANGTRIMASLLYLVRVIGEGRSFAALKALANAVDQRLQRASGANVDGQIFSCVREQVLKRSYIEEGKEYREVAQLFRLQVQGA